MTEGKMQDPNADTEWNDILRKKGILPPKESLKELEEEEAEKEEQLLQQSVGELAPSFPLSCVYWKQTTNRCSRQTSFGQEPGGRAGAPASRLCVVPRRVTRRVANEPPAAHSPCLCHRST